MRTTSVLVILGGILGVVAAQASCASTTCERTETCPSPFSEQVPDTDASDAQAPTSYMVSTLAGNGDAGADNGVGSAATFSAPTGIAVGPDGSLYVADTNNSKIRKIDVDGTVTTYAGTGTRGSTDGSCTTATFSSPWYIAVDAVGNIYVTDRLNNNIRKISLACQVSTLAGSVVGNSGASDGTGTMATFKAPQGLTLDASGNIYVADSANNKIRKVTPGGKVTTIAGTDVKGNIDGPVSSATFFFPVGIAVDAAGTLYVTEIDNNDVRKITANGQVSTLAGPGTVRAVIDGTGANAAFYNPSGIAVDTRSNLLLVTDAYNHVVRQVTSDGDVTTIAGQREAYTNKGVPGAADGPVNTATFNYPNGVAMDSHGVIYVVDTGNNKIRKFTPVPQ